LPPAAVLQGTIALGNAPANPDGMPPIALDAATHRLPFRLDRALVLLRGFKLAFRDGQAHEVARWRTRLAAPGTYAVPPGGSIRVSADALLLPAADNSGLANDALVYYSVLAWDSTQTELFTGAIEGAMENPEDDAVGALLETRDPCPVAMVSTASDPATYRADAEARCGQLFVAPRHLFQSSYWSFNDQEYDEIYLELGDYFRETLARGRGPRASLLHEDRRVQWGVSGALDGDGKEGIWQEVGGNVLTGRSLRVGPDPHPDTGAVGLSYSRGVALSLAYVGPRPPRGAAGHWTEPWSVWRRIGLSYPVFGDVAVVGVQLLHALPEGPLRELEVEVEGAYYDGQIVDWQYGAGVATDASGSKRRLVYAFPSFAAVRRTSAFAAPQLEARPALECQGVVGLGPTWCDNSASVINTGNGHALITEVAPGMHPQDARFGYSFIWRGQRLHDLAALRDRLPLQLRPGESLLVSARYTPEARPDGRESFLDIGFLTLRTLAPTIHTTVTANGHGRMPDPAGAWMPAALTLSAAAPAQTAALCPTGTTALVIDWNAPTGGLYFDPPAAGFSAAPAPNQPDECLAVIVSHPNPQSAAGAEAVLCAATNAGPIALPVRVAGN
jgi:hypothetical protein